jgi:hypothetical protein
MNVIIIMNARFNASSDILIQREQQGSECGFISNNPFRETLACSLLPSSLFLFFLFLVASSSCPASPKVYPKPEAAIAGVITLLGGVRFVLLAPPGKDIDEPGNRH